MIGRKAWLEGILESVQSIADRQYQEKTWFGKSQASSSPDEVYSELFDDRNFELYLQTFRATFTAEQLAAWLDLQTAMDQFAAHYGDHLDPHIVFHDPRWRSVQEAASAFLTAFGQEYFRG